MRPRELSVPTLALVAGTRVALGAGLGLLLAGKMAPDSRRAAGWALFLCGALTTIPLVVEVLGLESASAPSERLASRNPRQFADPWISVPN
jgi:hypothetical protein